MKKWLIVLIAAVLCAVFVSGMFLAVFINKSSNTNPVLGIGQSAQSEGTQVYDQGTLQIFMKVTGITGESTDSNHKGWMDVVSYNWTVQDILTSGRASLGAFQVVAEFGAASPQLFQYAANGNSLPQVTIQVQSTNSNGQSVEVCTWTLSNAVVVSYNTCSGVNGDTRILDQYNFLPQKVQVQYVPVNANGSPGSPVAASFDFSQNKAS